MTNDNASAVARICRVLDGMPLAIELAAARMRTMAVAQLAERLDDRFRLLTGGSRTAVPGIRHCVRSSTGAGSSYPTPSGSCCGGWRSSSAARRWRPRSGCAPTPPWQQIACPTWSPRWSTSRCWWSPETRCRATGCSRPSGRTAWTGSTRREARRPPPSARQVLRRTRRDRRAGLRRAEQLVWLRRLKADHDNLNAALRGAIAAGDAQTAVQLVAAAGWYWWLSGHKAEANELATEALAVPGAADDEARATAYAMVAWFASAGLGGLEQAEPWIRTAQELTKGIDHPGPLLRYVVEMGALLQNENASGLSAQDVMRPLIADEDPWVRAVARLTRNRMLRAGEQEADIQQALVEFRSIGERWGISYGLATLADLAARRGDLGVALDYGGQAADVLAELGAVEDLVFLKAREAQLRWLVGDETGSAAAMAQAEEDAASVGWPDAVAGMAYFKGRSCSLVR